MNKILLATLILFGFVSSDAQPIPVIKAVNNIAKYGVGTDWTRSWTISPQIARDTLLVKCYSEEILRFNTDCDSIRVPIRPGETRLFYVNLNNTEKALTVVVGQQASENLAFTNTGDEDSVRFWYGNDGGPYMKRLAEEYPTKTLAGGTNDLANIAALLEWTHKQWKHNGNQSPKNSDALSILEEVKAGHEFPCFAFSIVLAAKLSEAGYASRVLYLKAKTVETDKSAPGHVVTEVYAPSLHKWIFLDGQFNALPMLDGQPLNAVEFQRAIARNNEKIHFYNAVNYNGTPYTNRNYFDFVTPTLYYFDFGFDSRINTGARKPEKIMGKRNLTLVPEGASNPQKFGSFDGKIDYCLYTHNASLFYQKP